MQNLKRLNEELSILKREFGEDVVWQTGDDNYTPYLWFGIRIRNFANISPNDICLAVPLSRNFGFGAPLTIALSAEEIFTSHSRRRERRLPFCQKLIYENIGEYTNYYPVFSEYESTILDQCWYVCIHSDEQTDDSILTFLDILLGYLKAPFKYCKDSLAHFSKELESDPEDVAALIWLGYIHLNMQDYVRAQKYLERALKLNPDSLLARVKLAILAEEKNNLHEAISWYESMLAINPDDARATKAVKRLKEATRKKGK